MKHLFLTAAAISIVLCSCDPKKPEGSNLTPDQNKEKMEQIALDLMDQINPSDFDGFVNTVEYLVDGIGFPYETEEDYQEANRPVANLQAAGAPLFIGDLAILNTITRAATRAADVVISDLYTVYTYTDGEWVETPSETEFKLVFPFENKEVVIAASASGNTTDVTVDGTTVAVPAKVTMKMTHGTATLADITVDIPSIAADATSGEVNVSAELCGYLFETKTRATSSVVNVNAAILKKGAAEATMLIRADVTAAGSNLVPSVDDNDYNGKLGKVTAVVSLMDKAYLKGSCNNLQKFIDDMEALDDDESLEEEEWAKRYSALFNDNINVYMNYDNSDSAIAKLKLEAVKDGEYDYWYSEGYLVFTSDNSKFSFEDYFDDKSFADVINAFEELMEGFYNVFGYEEDDYR